MLGLLDLYTELVSSFTNVNTMQIASEGHDEDDEEPSSAVPFEGGANFPRATELRVAVDGNHKLEEALAEKFIQLESTLQSQILQLDEYVQHAPHEPRLKGPYPAQVYHEILKSCQVLLDRLLTMRSVHQQVTVKDEAWRDYLNPSRRERYDMFGTVQMTFYLAASALQIKAPLPQYIPSAAGSRKRLMIKIRTCAFLTDYSSKFLVDTLKFRVLYTRFSGLQCRIARNSFFLILETSLDNLPDSSRIIEFTTEQMTYYAYIIVMRDVIEELDRITARLRLLFGTLGGVAGGIKL